MFLLFKTGSFNGSFIPRLPYRLGNHSPPLSTHSPPIGLAHLPITPVPILRPQPQMPGILVGATSSPSSSSNNNLSPSLLQSSTPLSPLRIRVSSPTRLNTDLLTITATASSTASTMNLSNHMLTHNLINNSNNNNNNNLRISSSVIGHTILHRPFSPSPIPKDNS